MQADGRIVDWRERYEVEARKELEALDGLPESELIARVEAGRIDPYFALWRAIGRKGTLANAALPLWKFLRDHPGDAQMLNRYHGAAALFRVIGMDDPASEIPLRRRVQWDGNGEEARQEALLELRGLIDERLGSSA